MDQQKHSFPRSFAMQSKEFSNWSRPKLTSTTVLSHGYTALIVLSPPTTPSTSSRTIDILGCVLTKGIQQGIHWPAVNIVNLRVQADNCSKELKHQTSLRLGAVLVAGHRLASFTMSFLQSGHSHEDIDAMFSCVAEHLSKHTELHTMSAFKDCLQSFLDRKDVRPWEKHRKVLIMERYLDWILRQNCCLSFTLGGHCVNCVT